MDVLTAICAIWLALVVVVAIVAVTITTFGQKPPPR